MHPSLAVAVLAAHAHLSSRDFHVLAIIASGQNARAEIARMAGCSVPTVARAIASLVARGWVQRHEQKGRPSCLSVDHTRITHDTGSACDTTTRITDDTPKPQTRIKGEPTTRITRATRITHDTTTHISPDTGVAYDTGQAGDNFGAHIEHAHARAETPITNTYTQVELYPERPSPSSTAAVVLNGRARSMPAHELARVAVDAVNSPWLDPHKSQKLITTAGRFQVWQQAGADFDTDILPTIRALCLRATEPIRTWTYFDNAIRAAIAQRIEAETPMLPVTLSEARNDQRARSSRDAGRTHVRAKGDPVFDRLLDDLNEPEDQPLDLGRLVSHAL